MRICLVSREVAPFWGAGIGVYVGEMARAYAGAGHEVHVVTAPHGNLRDPVLAAALPGVNVHAADPDDLASVGCPAPDARAIGYARYGFQAHALACHRVLRRLQERAPLDYIEFPEYWADGYFALTDRRTTGAFEGAVMGVRLHTPTELAMDLNGEHVLDVPTALLQRMELESMRLADVLISPCQSLLDHAQMMIDRDDAVPPPGVVVPYPFNVAAAREALAGDPGELPQGDGPLVIYFGRYERRKGVDLLAAAARRLLDRGVPMRLVMVGGDTLSGRFGRSMAEEVRGVLSPYLGTSVRVEGPRPREQLGGLLRAADIVCLPSRWENFPNALLESMALGSCCVVGDRGGMAEIIEDGVSGVSFASGDATALERTLEGLLDDAPKREALGRAARERVERLCEPAVVVGRMAGVIEGHRAGMEPIVPDAKAGPRVSIIIPFYNLAHTIDQTLASVRAQTLADYEVLVVDDGSTQPQSQQAIDRLENEFDGKQWRVLRKANGGLGSARNFGIAHARANLVLPLDADDVLEPTFLERVVGAMDRDPGLAAVGTLVRYFEDVPQRVTGAWLPVGFDRDLLCCENWACNATALLRKDALLEAGGYDEALTAFEDWDLYCGLARLGHRCLIVPEFLFCYRIRPNSMLRTEGTSRRVALCSTILARHPGLARRPDRALRIEVSKSVDQRARELLEENIRYRLADKANEALRGLGLQRTIKGLASIAIRPKRQQGNGQASSPSGV